MEDTKLIDESSQELKAILDGIGEGISIIDEDLKIVWVNPIITKWAGSLEDIKGKYCYKVYQKKDTPCENCPTVKAFKTGKIEKARQYAYDTQGNIRYFEFTSAPMLDESKKTQMAVELAVDLTEKIELEHKLKEVKDRLEAIFDGIGDGVSVIDKNHQILRVNQGILNLFNKMDFSDLIGRKCFSEYYKNEGICENCPAEKTFEEGKPCHVTRICQGIDKGRIVLDISTFPIKDEDGKVIQVIEYMKNITDIVKLEDQLLYQERLAGIGELAAGIAHEIRNPLGSITASSQFVLSKYRLPDPVKKHLKIILRNSENANGIIKDLLDFAKPREISFKKGNIKDVIDSTCNLVKVRCAKQRVRLARKWSRRLPSILLDEKRLEEAFLNFILNALDAMPGGGRLMINAHPDFEANEVVISFLDTGEGIAPENLNKMFSPFFSTKEDGVGLGLCLAHQVISYHKGRINVVGSLIALGIAGLVGLLLKTIQLEKGAKKIKIPEILKKGGIGLSLSELLTEIIFFVIIVATLITALEFYGVGTGVLMSSILAYVPQVISAVFILILGILVAILISGIIKLVGGNVKIAQSDTLGNVAKYAIIILSTVIALKELGLGIILTDKSKDIIFAGLVLALALGFGLGLKGKAEDFLGKIFKK